MCNSLHSTSECVHLRVRYNVRVPHMYMYSTSCTQMCVLLSGLCRECRRGRGGGGARVSDVMQCSVVYLYMYNSGVTPCYA